MGECTFDGKIRTFLFTEEILTKRASKNRPKGEVLETKMIELVNKKPTRHMLITKRTPRIKSNWPSEEEKIIFIQQDNCKAHITQNDVEEQEHYNNDGFMFILIQQPPDIGVGFF